MKKHEIIHTNEKNINADYVTKCLNNANSLKFHNNLHNAEKPYH